MRITDFGIVLLISKYIDRKFSALEITLPETVTQSIVKMKCKGFYLICVDGTTATTDSYLKLVV